MTSCPAVIVETAFVDNAKDIQIIDTEAERKQIGIALAKGILKTLNIEFKEEKKTLYRVQVGAFYNKAYADDMLKKLKKDGYDGFIVTA
jgi:N-acetylmuramoyl-L-alanine amidase